LDVNIFDPVKILKKALKEAGFDVEHVEKKGKRTILSVSRQFKTDPKIYNYDYHSKK